MSSRPTRTHALLASILAVTGTIEIAPAAHAQMQMPGEHGMDDRAMNSYVLFDQLELTGKDSQAWEAHAWFGQDMQRLWLRTQGMHEDSRTTHAEAQALYGQKISPWWEWVAGVRQDFKPGPATTFAAVGIQGLAPYKIEIEATAYLGERGKTQARLETRYELLITNRLVLQPRAEINAGVQSREAGLRLRYEIRRELAPYVGANWVDEPGDHGTRFVAGVRAWF